VLKVCQQSDGGITDIMVLSPLEIFFLYSIAFLGHGGITCNGPCDETKQSMKKVSTKKVIYTHTVWYGFSITFYEEAIF
jgi:hypothetical protein